MTSPEREGINSTECFFGFAQFRFGILRLKTLVLWLLSQDEYNTTGEIQRNTPYIKQAIPSSGYRNSQLVTVKWSILMWM